MNVNFNESSQVNIMLAESVEEIEEVVVTGVKNNHNVESIEMSTEKMPVRMVKKLPSFMVK